MFEIKGPARLRTDQGLQTAADICGCELAAIKAVIAVESAGHGFAGIRPVIRWERHWAIRLARKRGDNALVARFKKLPKANARDQGARYALLDRARSVDESIALQAHSYGAMQVMGFNYAQCGFSSVHAFVHAMCEGEDEQIQAAAKWIVANHIDDELQRGDFTGFARVYNGPSYAKNAYDTRMAAEYERAGGSGAGRDDSVLSVGSRGSRVRDLQEELGRLGYYVKPDGDFGPDTRRQVMAFQASNGLIVDGRVGSNTLAAMKHAAPLDTADKSFVTTVKNSTVAQTGLGTAAGGVGAVAKEIADSDTSEVVDKISDAGQKARDVTEAVDGFSTLWTFVSDNLVLVLGFVVVALGVYIVVRNHTDILSGKKKS